MKRSEIRQRILKNLRAQGQQREQRRPPVERRARTTTLYS